MVQPFVGVTSCKVAIAVMRELLGPELACERLASDTPLGHGSVYQAIHADGPGLTPDENGIPTQGAFINWPLCDVDEANGPFEFAPGSHLLPVPDAHLQIQSGELPLRRLTMRKGDIIIRDPCCLHRASPNCTAVPRPMLVLSWSVSQNVAMGKGNICPGIESRVLEQLGDEQRKLLRAIKPQTGPPHASLSSLLPLGLTAEDAIR